MEKYTRRNLKIYKHKQTHNLGTVFNTDTAWAHPTSVSVFWSPPTGSVFFPITFFRVPISQANESMSYTDTETKTRWSKCFCCVSCGANSLWGSIRPLALGSEDILTFKGCFRTLWFSLESALVYVYFIRMCVRSEGWHSSMKILFRRSRSTCLWLQDSLLPFNHFPLTNQSCYRGNNLCLCSCWNIFMSIQVPQRSVLFTIQILLTTTQYQYNVVWIVVTRKQTQVCMLSERPRCNSLMLLHVIFVLNQQFSPQHCPTV